MALMDDLTEQIKKQQQNPYATEGGSDAVSALNQQYNADLVNSLGQLSNKYGGQLAAYGQQMDKAKTQGQDTLEQNAIDASGNQMRARETMANSGTANGGQAIALESQIRTALENANNRIFKQRQDDQATIQAGIDELNKEGAVDLQGILQLSQTSRDAAVRQQQATEEAQRRQEEALAKAQAAAEEAARQQAENNRLVEQQQKEENKYYHLQSVIANMNVTGPDNVLNFLIENYSPDEAEAYAHQIPYSQTLRSEIGGVPLKVTTLAGYAEAISNGYVV